MKRYFVQLASVRADVISDVLNKLHGDGFFTLICQNADENKEIRLETEKALLFEFDAGKKQNNCIDCFKTDFIRFCASLTKMQPNSRKYEIPLVPWLDFNEEWTDEKLFEKFKVSKELQEYIREFLPDYYNIR